VAHFSGRETEETGHEGKIVPFFRPFRTCLPVRKEDTQMLKDEAGIITSAGMNELAPGGAI
jgi:hypothetical protein